MARCPNREVTMLFAPRTRIVHQGGHKSKVQQCAVIVGNPVHQTPKSILLITNMVYRSVTLFLRKYLCDKYQLSGCHHRGCNCWYVHCLAASFKLKNKPLYISDRANVSIYTCPTTLRISTYPARGINLRNAKIGHTSLVHDINLIYQVA